MGLIKPDSGNVKIFGKTVSREDNNYLRDIRAIIETLGFYNNLSAYENLENTTYFPKCIVKNKLVMTSNILNS